MPVVLDSLPALVVPALVLIALALRMPFTGKREAARRQAWGRFHLLARQRQLDPLDRDALAAWAREELPEAPFQVLARRRDFDRFARSEVARASSLAGTPVHAAILDRLAALRSQLGFGRAPGLAQSTHDVAPGERLELRHDDGEKLDLRVVSIDEEGLVVEPMGRRRGVVRGGPAWASFSRDGEGTYRFRSALRPRGAGRLHLAHGDFLVREERRREPRAPVSGRTFWVAVERLPDGFAPDDPEGVEVEPLDVSSGGLALLADRDVRRGSELGVDLPLGDTVVPGLRARVVGRGYREGGGRRPHFLHCAFIDLDPVQRRAIEEFVIEHAPA